MNNQWKVVGAYVFGKKTLITIQHKATKDILQLCASNKTFSNLIENGLDEAIIEIVLNNYNSIE